MGAIEQDFAPRLLAWFERHGRHDLPWQHPRTPYRVWLSEIMLQQTQVSVVIPYFQRFIDALPDLPSLARASQDQVLALWSGLGYYARARNLHAAAKRCMELHDGDLPRDLDALIALPGIGRSTAGAILSQAWGDAAPILDGNVKRVLCRLFAIEGWPGTPAVEKTLWRIAGTLLPDARLAFIDVPGVGAEPLRMRVQEPGDPHARFPSSFVFVDRYSGRVLAVHDVRRGNAATTTAAWIRVLHDGSVAGLTTRILAIFLGLVPLGLFVTGFLHWRRRLAAGAQSHSTGGFS